MRSTNRTCIKVFLAILLALIVTIGCSRSFRTDGIRIELIVSAPEVVPFHLIYEEEKSSSLEEGSISVANRYTNQPELLRVTIPAKQLHSLRLQFDKSSRDQEFTLLSLEVNGSAWDVRQFLDESTMNGIAVLGEHGNAAEISVQTGKAEIVFPMAESLESKHYYDWMTLLSIFFLSVILSWAVLFQYFPRFFMRRGIIFSRDIAEKLFFLTCISAVLVYPVTRIDQEESSTRENRALAVFPSLQSSSGLNPDFGKQFEAWLNDRFAGRKRYIRLNDQVNSLLNFSQRENREAFEGKDGWLFYKGDNSIKLYQRSIPFTEEQLETIRTNLEQQKDWFDSQGIVYSVLILPNKEDVYGEFYNPHIIQKNTKDRVQQLGDYLQQTNCSVKVLYLLPEMLAAKDNGQLLYWKQDTHWSRYGAWIGYLAWMDALKQQGIPVQSLQPEQMVFKETTEADVDLAKILGLEPDRKTMYLEPTPVDGWKYKEVERQTDKAGTPKFVRTVCPGKSGKVIIFRDSFTQNLMPYLSSTFGEVIYVWDHMDAYANLVVREKPDLVLREMLSRMAMELCRDTEAWKGQVN